MRYVFDVFNEKRCTERPSPLRNKRVGPGAGSMASRTPGKAHEAIITHALRVQSPKSRQNRRLWLGL